MKITFENTTGVTFTHLKNIASNDILRPVLTGAYIDVVNKVIVCTDAHILMMYPIEIVHKKEFEYNKDTEFNKNHCKIVPIELFNKNKYLGNWRQYIFPFTYELGEKRVSVFAGPEKIFECGYIEGEYPKYENIVPKKEDRIPIDSIGFSSNLLAKFGKSVPRGTGDFSFNFFAKRKGVLVKESKIDNPIIGVIMPLGDYE